MDRIAIIIAQLSAFEKATSGGRFLHSGRDSRDQRREFAAVDLHCGILRPDAFEIHHRRLDVAVAEPVLHGADVHTVAQMVRGEASSFGQGCRQLRAGLSQS